MLFPPSRRAPRGTSPRRRTNFRPRIDDLESRIVQTAYVYPGPNNHFAVPSRVTYSFVPDGTSWGVAGTTPTTGSSNLDATLSVAFGSSEGWKMQFRQAFATWSAATNINFYEVSELTTAYPEGSNGVPGPNSSATPSQGNSAFGDIRIGGLGFGSANSSTLALTVLPNNPTTASSDISFNTDWIFTIDGGSTTRDLQTVALHEIGHALGLDHNTGNSPAVMTAVYGGPRRSLAPDDVDSVRFLYGGPRNLATYPAPATLSTSGAFLSQVTLNPSNTTTTYTAFGDPTLDIPAVADYDNDNIDDKAVYRPSTGDWKILFSTTGLVQTHNFGNNRTQPVPGDYDGDHIKEFAVYDLVNGTFNYIRSTDSQFVSIPFGNPRQHVAVRGNFDGTGGDDIAVYEPATATWYIRGSNPIQFGSTGDVPVPGDYDNDGKTDLAVWRPSTSQYLVRGSAGSFYTYYWANRGYDIPLAANFNGDNRVELVGWRVTFGNAPVGSPAGTGYATAAAAPSPSSSGTSSSSTASRSASTSAGSSYVLVPLPDATTEATPAPVKSTRTPKGPRDFAPRWASLV